MAGLRDAMQWMGRQAYENPTTATWLGAGAMGLGADAAMDGENSPGERALGGLAAAGGLGVLGATPFGHLVRATTRDAHNKFRHNADFVGKPAPNTKPHGGMDAAAYWAERSTTYKQKAAEAAKNGDKKAASEYMWEAKIADRVLQRDFGGGPFTAKDVTPGPDAPVRGLLDAMEM